MLTNFDIEELCNRLDLDLVLIDCKDKLKEYPIQMGSYYINLQDSDEGDGTHWVYARVFCDDEDNSDSDDDVGVLGERSSLINCLYFDPFGLDMPEDVSEYFKDFKPIPYNNRQIQNIRSTQCGWYCLACDYELTHRKYDFDTLENFEDFIKLWSSDPKENLTILKEYFEPL